MPRTTATIPTATFLKGTARGFGGGARTFPRTGAAANGTSGGHACPDGSYGNAYSAALIYKNGPWTAIAAYELHEGVNRHGDDGLEPGLVAQVFLPGGPAAGPFGTPVLTGVHNEWAAKVGGGYRFNDGLGDVQLNAFYEWLRREVTPDEQPFNERSRDGVFASATQFIGKWSVSASYAHAFKTPGNPTCLSFNNANAGVSCLTPAVPAGQFQANLFDDSASQYA